MTDHNVTDMPQSSDRAASMPESREADSAQNEPGSAESVQTVIPPGTTPPKVSVEVWDGEDQVGASVADVVRINDTWHVVVTLDD